jgi:hypothetical protein
VFTGASPLMRTIEALKKTLFFSPQRVKTRERVSEVSEALRNYANVIHGESLSETRSD